MENTSQSGKRNLRASLKILSCNPFQLEFNSMQTNGPQIEIATIRQSQNAHGTFIFPQIQETQMKASN